MTATETFSGIPALDLYAFPIEEPQPSDLSINGCNKWGPTAHYPKALPPVHSLASSLPHMRYPYPDPNNAESSVYSLSGPGLSPSLQPQDLSTPHVGPKMETAKKKKGKADREPGQVKPKKPRKTKKVKGMLESSSGQQGVALTADGHSLSTSSSLDLPFPDSTYQFSSGDSKQSIKGMKAAAPSLLSSLYMSSDSSTSPHPYSYQGSNVMMSSMPPTPPTNFSNLNLRSLPDGRRQSMDSQDQPASRPGSRASTASTTSSTCESKTKEPVDSIPLSKVLEIIEREKALGSSSPCKRRRTAKPQHIQDAEEEAKKYAALNATSKPAIDSSSLSSSAKSENLADSTPVSTSAKHRVGTSSVKKGAGNVLDNSSINSNTENVAGTIPLSASSRPVVDGSIAQNSQLPKQETVVDKHAEMPDKGFCCSGCEKDGSVSSKSCEQKLAASLSSKLLIETSVTTSKDAADQIMYKVSHPQQGASEDYIHHLHSSSHNTPTHSVKDSSLLSQSPHCMRSIAVEATRANGNKLSAGIDDLSKFAANSSLCYQSNGFLSQKEAAADSEVPEEFTKAFRHYLKSTAAEFSAHVTSHIQAPTVCTAATKTVSSVSSVSSASSMVKTETVAYEDLQCYNTQKLPSSKEQNRNLTHCKSNHQTVFHTSNIQADTLNDGFFLADATTRPRSGISSNPMLNGQLSPLATKGHSPSPIKKKKSEWSQMATSNGMGLSGMESFLPQTRPPHSPSSRSPAGTGPPPSPGLAVGSAPSSPIGPRGSGPHGSPMWSSGSPAQPQAFIPLPSCGSDRAEHLHKAFPGASYSSRPHHDTLTNSGPLPPFGAFAGLKSDVHNMTYSGAERHQDPNGFHTKREASVPVVKKSKKKQKSALHTQNTAGDHHHSKLQGGGTGFLSSGLKDRNLKPLNGNWSNMQQVAVMDDKSNLKPATGDYSSTMKPTFISDGAEVKPVTGTFSKVDPSHVASPPLTHKASSSPVKPPSSPYKPPSSPYKPPSSPSPSTAMPNFANMSPEEELADRLASNRVENVPQCSCLGPNYVFNESIEGPYYTQLGAAKDVPSLRAIMEQRTGLSGKAIRLEKIHYTGKEGRSTQGCPIAKWIIRRSGLDEKYLCVARKRPGHFCDAAYLIVVIVAWEGVASEHADSLYSYLVPTLTKHGFETDRRCGTNDQKTCACQGADLLRRGASFSFGCSWSMYFNGCKFARSHIARKFKLKDTQKEEELEDHLQDLATVVGPVYKMTAPDAYRNQTHFEENAAMCRLGKEKGRPFSGVTACVDFCAHSHKDFHNMQNGCTVVVTLTKHRGLAKADDEQLHVLPLYVLDNTDENGSIDGHMDKVQSGALEILHDYPIQARMRAAPLTPKRRGRQAKKDSPAKRGAAATQTEVTSGGGRTSAPGTPTPLTPTSKEASFTFHSEDSNQSLPDTFSGNNSMQSPDKGFSSGDSLYVNKENSSTSEEFLSQTFGPSEMYEKVWEYFYSNGSFPPQVFMDKWAAVQKQAMMNPQHPDSLANNGANTLSGSSPSSVISPLHHQTQAAEQASPHMAGDQSVPFMASSPKHPDSNPSSPFAPMRRMGSSLEGSPSPANHPGSNPPSPFPSPAHSSVPDNSHSQPGSPFGSGRLNCDGTNPLVCNASNSSTPGNPVMQTDGSFVAPTLGQGPDEPTFTMMDPTVVKCEWQDNKESFHDPGIGGVAIALNHGAMLFEVAKREMHATTSLKNPNRYQPTRISLVFYQHKNLNYYHHGYYEYERKLATQRQKRIEKLMEEGATAAEAEKAVKPGRKRKKKEGEEEEKIDFAKTSAAQYKYMWEANVKHSSTLTTDSIITRWIDPQPMVTGPYQRWV